MKIRLTEGATLPTLGSIGSAGYDLYASESTTVEAKGWNRVKTGVHLEIPRGQKGVLAHRSGLNTTHGLQVYGTIDSDYRGEIIITVFNQARFRDYKIQKGDRIAQISFVDVNYSVFEIVDELPDTHRGEGGHGSTGR